MRRPRRAVLVGSLSAVLLAGCVPPEPATVPAVREDPAPIRKRIKNIGDRFSVRWVGGSRGDERVPGPSATWLDAVIALQDDEVAGRLLVAAGATANRVRPEIASALGDPGTGATSTGLDAFVAVEPGTVRAFLYPDRRVLVVKYFQG